MSRVLLIHWNAEEAEEMTKTLKQSGYRADYYASQESAPLRAIRQDPPDAFVIDLNRLPSHGRAVAIWLRQQKATRGIPLVFIRGDQNKTQQVRELLPDATYTEWERIDDALRKAIQSPLSNPVVPGTMDSYSATPLPKKLGIKTGSMVALLAAPEGFEQALAPLPESVTLRRVARGSCNVILLFVTSRSHLRRRFPAADRALARGGKLWIIWQKRASGVTADPARTSFRHPATKSGLSQNTVRSFCLAAGYVDYKISAIDDTWSGLCFARRR